ncbi:hypothetical protein N752_13250 [Desulforamulus aquiferis]|nr:hypothetical protein N752_13250 [Desulforamulus aquiferis]
MNYRVNLLPEDLTPRDTGGMKQLRPMVLA